ncbi:GDSL-type esterase/lipase family protein [Terriglobus tenax]|uniref:GDSL-type esterase/lipase family protein n=1 Tax=Terriglobus tenax TaxID=1111115 RepID=UPI0021E051A7|nr:GDSL-type esterase/lipase family protein [Terriglobus tenax]
MRWIFLLLSLASIPCFSQNADPANAASSDFAQLRRYQEANTHVTGPVQVVFLGDSITDYWGSHNGTWFPYSGWINRGIGGQTTQQMLLRERQDALNLQPKAIVLEGAGNDMRLGFSPEAIRDNLLSMGELAQSHGIQVYVAEMTPVCDCVRPLTGLRTVERIRQLNHLLAAMCREKHWDLLRFNHPLADQNGLMRADLTVDGVHPNDAGYALLAPVVEKALARYRRNR